MIIYVTLLRSSSQYLEGPGVIYDFWPAVLQWIWCVSLAPTLYSSLPALLLYPSFNFTLAGYPSAVSLQLRCGLLPGVSLTDQLFLHISSQGEDQLWNIPICQRQQQLWLCPPPPPAGACSLWPNIFSSK